MRLKIAISSILLISGCSLTPKEVSEGIVECEYYGLIPVAVVRNSSIKKISCLPPEDLMVIEKDLKLIKLPKLPDIGDGK